MNANGVCRLYIPRSISLNAVDRFWDAFVPFLPALKAAESDPDDYLHGLLAKIDRRLNLAWQRDPAGYEEATGSRRHPRPNLASVKYTRRHPASARALAADREATKDLLEPALLAAHIMGYVPFWNALRHPDAVAAATDEIGKYLVRAMDSATGTYRDDEDVTAKLLKYARNVHDEALLATFERALRGGEAAA